MKIMLTDFKTINYDNISLDYLINKEGKIFSKKTNSFLSGSIDKDGYQRFNLIRNDGTRKTYRIHRLVSIVFNPTDNLSLQVNHIDGNKQNNNITNLEWVTGDENIAHAIKNNLRGKGRAILEEVQVHSICQLLAEGYAPKMIAQKLFPTDVEQFSRIIQDIRRGKNWTSVSKNYKIDVPYKYGEAFKSNYTIWELENICDFLSHHLEEKSNTKLAKIYFQDDTITYKDKRVTLIKDIKTKQKYQNVSKFYF